MFFGKVRTITCCRTLVLLFVKACGLLTDNKITFSARNRQAHTKGLITGTWRVLTLFSPG